MTGSEPSRTPAGDHRNPRRPRLPKLDAVRWFDIGRRFGLTAIERLVLVTLAVTTPWRDEEWVGTLADLQSDTGAHPRTIRAAIQTLADHGLVEVRLAFTKGHDARVVVVVRDQLIPEWGFGRNGNIADAADEPEDVRIGTASAPLRHCSGNIADANRENGGSSRYIGREEEEGEDLRSEEVSDAPPPPLDPLPFDSLTDRQLDHLHEHARALHRDPEELWRATSPRGQRDWLDGVEAPGSAPPPSGSEPQADPVPDFSAEPDRNTGFEYHPDISPYALGQPPPDDQQEPDDDHGRDLDGDDLEDRRWAS